MYNKFTEECFSRCIQNLNYRMMTQEEVNIEEQDWGRKIP